MPNSATTYRAKVLAAHRPAFDLFNEVAGAFETAVLEPRYYPTPTYLVLDMFMAQAHKTYGAVSLVGQHGLMEDSGTLSRRLLAISVQSVYIGAESETKLRDRKSGQYLAFLWRQLPRRIKHRLPSTAREHWSAIAVMAGSVRSRPMRPGKE